MYLVHVRLRNPAGEPLPDAAATLVRSSALPGDRLELVVAHPREWPSPVLGIFLLADTLAEAEARAAQLCRRACARHPPLADWELVEAQAPLLTPLYERPLE